MRILIISTFFPPLNSIASLRPYSWAKYFRDQGCSVTILTTHKPNLDKTIHHDLPLDEIEVLSVEQKSLIIKLRTKQQNKEEEKTGGLISNLRHKTGIFSSCRMPDISDMWALKAYKKVARLKPWDIVISTSGPYTTHYIAQKLKKSNITKCWVADYRDFWTNHELFTGLFPFTILEKYLEQKWMAHADIITTVSNGLKSSLQTLLPDKQVHTIMNGFDENISDVQLLQKESDYLRIVYTGTIYNGLSDPKLLLVSLNELFQESLLLRQKVTVDFYGKYNADFQKLIQNYDLTDIVKQHGMVDIHTSLSLQKNASMLAFFEPSFTNNKGIITGKLFEYIYSGTPILAIGIDDSNESAQIIISSNSGYVCSDNVSTIKQSILMIYQGECKTAQNRLEVMKYSRQNQAEKLYELLLDSQ